MKTKPGTTSPELKSRTASPEGGFVVRGMDWLRRLFKTGSANAGTRSSRMGTATQSPTGQVLKRYRVPEGQSLYDLSCECAVLLVFLRHAGCTFCREALGDLATVEDRIRTEGSRLVLVHMGSDREGEELVQRFGLREAHVISDPSLRLYRDFHLRRGTWRQLFGPRVMWRGFNVAILRRFGFGLPRNDTRQMPGVFLIREGRVVREYRHEYASDRPDYVALTSVQS